MTLFLLTAAATGVGRSSVYRVTNEYKATYSLKSPKKGKLRQILSEIVDDFNRNVIQRKEQEFFYAGLGNFRRTPFYKLLREMNFKYVRHGRDSLLIDRDDIILWRRRYLRTIKRLRDEGHTRSYVWVDDTINSSKEAFLSGLSTGSKSPSGKGKRLIISHIDSKAGFVEGCLWTFESKISEDYHEEMCAETFEKWFHDVLFKVLLEEAGRTVTAEDWNKCVLQVVEKMETRMWKLDCIIEERGERFVINLNENSCSSAE
ncbi:uncharacterized protein LOC126278911 [Schistocerca gregaria]|uniref:uncharacterized protein LOC126278911 n=1 Tax=Schistocerca gregaria TaxID=7010 RepID=UPI00211EB511|nr:uncharacterized protein LOC126278911 [Schistocerca gregaria]